MYKILNITIYSFSFQFKFCVGYISIQNEVKNLYNKTISNSIFLEHKLICYILFQFPSIHKFFFNHKITIKYFKYYIFLSLSLEVNYLFFQFRTYKLSLKTFKVISCYFINRRQLYCNRFLSDFAVIVKNKAYIS
jgi:hypothetical protein